MVCKEKSILYVYTAILLAVTFQGACGQYYHNDLDGLHPPEEATTWCFQCTSVLDKDCALVQPNDTSSYHYKPCLDTEKYQGAKPFCRKIVQKITVRDNMEIVIRKCGWVRHPRLDCYRMRNEDHEETICQCFEMGCNSSPSPHHRGPLAVTLAMLVVLGFRGL